jgi:hypothetical protein
MSRDNPLSKQRLGHLFKEIPSANVTESLFFEAYGDSCATDSAQVQMWRIAGADTKVFAAHGRKLRHFEPRRGK